MNGGIYKYLLGAVFVVLISVSGWAWNNEHDRITALEDKGQTTAVTQALLEEVRYELRRLQIKVDNLEKSVRNSRDFSTTK